MTKGNELASTRTVKSPCKPLGKSREPPSPPRLSPVKMQGGSPRTSPGFLAGHYAGCKWTEPPSPSALPQPPQHWMQIQSQQQQLIRSFHNKSDQQNIAHQLKVLLKVQA